MAVRLVLLAIVVVRVGGAVRPRGFLVPTGLGWTQALRRPVLIIVHGGCDRDAIQIRISGRISWWQISRRSTD